MEITNKYGLPESLLNAAKNDKYSRGDAEFSVTTLIDSPRIAALMNKHGSGVEIDVADKIFAMLGSALHDLVEQGAHYDEESEQRLYADVDGTRISGKMDVLRITDRHIVIRDFKVCSVWKGILGDRGEWERQLNSYAFLVEQNYPDHEIGGLEIVALFRDWRKADSQRKGDYPEAPIQTYHMPVWSREARREYVSERVAAHSTAKKDTLSGGEPPLCTDDERWMREQKFAVVTPGMKRAHRVFSRREDAERYINSKTGRTGVTVRLARLQARNMRIEERPKEYIRCEEYCPVREFCSQRTGEKVMEEFRKVREE